jgi:methanogen homocitrate synthase
MRKNISLPISAHLHNDFGLALINAITALGSGATHVCTTINGWGERAGNVSLEQLVMALKVLYNKDLGINTTSLKDLSETVSNMCKVPLPKTQPFVGDNIFTHESGIHVAAILENPYTYEPISPESVGNKRNLIIGKHSGKKMIKHFLEKNEIKIDDKNLLELVFEIKNFSETNGKISSEQILKFAKNRSKLP